MPTVVATSSAYHRAGSAYRRYADGSHTDLLHFSGPHAEADRRIWSAIDLELIRQREAGRRTLRVLDVGCGPGTWLARVGDRAAALGFERVGLNGCDLAGSQIVSARAQLRDVVRRHGDALRSTLVEGDAEQWLPTLRSPYDLVLCLYSVISHLSARARPVVAAELARLTRGRLLVSVRAAGSTPTIYVDGLDRARSFRQDHVHDRLSVDLADGRHLELPSHLFRAAELRALFAPCLPTCTLTGLDLFHGRFAPDPRWNPGDLDPDNAFADRLAELERQHAEDPALIDHATHLLLSADVAGPL